MGLPSKTSESLQGSRPEGQFPGAQNNCGLYGANNKACSSRSMHICSRHMQMHAQPSPSQATSLSTNTALPTLAHPAPAQVNYKNVMKQYSLGPNGGILTSCNLFATRFDQVGAVPPAFSETWGFLAAPFESRKS